jgi:hypothetical protein
MGDDRLPNDCRVILQNLVSKPENNGREGFVKSFLEDLQKYQVLGDKTHPFASILAVYM